MVGAKMSDRVLLEELLNYLEEAIRDRHSVAMVLKKMEEIRTRMAASNQCIHLRKVDWCRFSDMHLDFDCTKSPCESYEKRSKPK